MKKRAFKPSLHYSTSGSPAILVSIDSAPATTEALTTSFQSTVLITDPVPIVATAVCATVFRALMPAAFIHLDM